MTEKTVQGKRVVFVIMGIVMAAVAATVYFSDLRESLRQPVVTETPAAQEPTVSP